MVPIRCRNRWTGPVSPVMSMPLSDPAKMRAVRVWVVPVTVTSAGAGGPRSERPLVAVAFDQVVHTVEAEVPLAAGPGEGGNPRSDHHDDGNAQR
jgi:hypothetical protein